MKNNKATKILSEALVDMKNMTDEEWEEFAKKLAEELGVEDVDNVEALADVYKREWKRMNIDDFVPGTAYVRIPESVFSDKQYFKDLLKFLRLPNDKSSIFLLSSSSRVSTNSILLACILFEELLSKLKS